MKRGELRRLLNPASLVVVGGGVWGRSVISQCRKIGFAGDMFVVHPTADEVEGLPAFRSVADLPVAPDAAFIGVNRDATIEIVSALAEKGAGGAVCFASGFLEADAEDADGAARQQALITAAKDMPFIGPNCYGFINYLDQFCIWPDQHGGQPVSSGVAIVTQSSNIMISLTMQQRGLPVAYAFTAGNQARISLSALGRELLADPRVTALGLHIEGIGDVADFEQLARFADKQGKPVVALKVGRSAQAQAATISHTASLAGSDAAADALLRRLGIGRADSLSELMEALKLLHQAGPLPGRAVASISCSGGEAALMADLAVLQARGLHYPKLTDAQEQGLRAALGSRVALANPLDYHTYIWGDVAAMADTFTAMLDGPVDIGVVVVDFPRNDRCSTQAWHCVIEAAALARQRCGKPMALLATLVENMPEDLADRAAQQGLIPLSGMAEGLAAIAVAADCCSPAARLPVWPAPAPDQVVMKDEAASKDILRGYGLDIPQNLTVTGQIAPETLPFAYPVVLKAMGVAHKSDMGGVRVGLSDRQALQQAMTEMNQPAYLIEELITDAVAEVLIGVVGDPVHGYLLTLAAGGVLTELLADSQSLLLPVTGEQVAAAVDRLKLAPVLAGYRGKPAADIDKLIDAVLAVQACVDAFRQQDDGQAAISEIEINPLILTPTRAVAVDALIRKGDSTDV